MGKLGELPGQPRVDDMGFWAQHVRISTVLYSLCCIVVFGYLAATRHAPNRPGLVIVVVVALVAAFGFDRVRWHVVRSRYRMPLLYGWSSLTMGLVTTVSWLDGGARSPLALLLFIAMNYVVLAYPPRAVLAMAAAAMSAYILLAVSHPGQAWPVTGVTVAILGLCGFLGSLAAHNHWQQAEAQQRLADSLAAQATRDHLTGCLNRRAFDARLAEEVERASRSRRPLSLLIVDVDNFKEVNDTQGHLGGDLVLEQVSAILIDGCRASDVVGRIGGDEFVIILPDTYLETAAALAERLRLRVRSLATPVPVSLSIGGAEQTDATVTGEELLRLADAALYRAKKTGRDRVAV
jgi:diguanylate cyclase (GGDEF)-like protein